MKKILSIILLSIFAIQSNGQNEASINLPKKVGSLDIDLLSAEFSTAFSVGSRTMMGYGFQLGAGFRYNLNQAKQSDFHMEFARLKFFWSYYLRQNTFLRTGIFGSIGRMADFEIGNQVYFTGIHLDFYTGWNRIKFGIKTQNGYTFMTYNSVGKRTDFFMMTVAPAVQYQFK
ncbi:MAG: hypothetical protein KDC05_16855 [Bacteroidales bacterium]|nr:hypothetical protein [Bacteroidales bacterium]